MNADNRAQTLLDELLAADAAALEAHEKLRELDDQEEVSRTVVARLRQTLSSAELDAAGELVVQRLLEICAEVPEKATTEAILVALEHANPLIRDVAAEAALARAYERYAEVARVFESGSLGPHATQELCFVFAQIGEPSTVQLLTSALHHDDPDVVSAAIEALTEHGDAAAARSLQALLGDTREVTLEHGDEEFVATVGELAQEAIEELKKGKH